jgi:myo-inositol 2-dehydrogenase/D-chiro-inositol 1-dehydrogenase
MDRYMDSFAAELRCFVDAVIHDKPTPVGGEDGRMAVVLGLAARQSYEEGRPVKVENPGGFAAVSQ